MYFRTTKNNALWSNRLISFCLFYQLIS